MEVPSRRNDDKIKEFSFLPPMLHAIRERMSYQMTNEFGLLTNHMLLLHTLPPTYNRNCPLTVR